MSWDYITQAYGEKQRRLGPSICSTVLQCSYPDQFPGLTWSLPQAPSWLKTGSGCWFPFLDRDLPPEIRPNGPSPPTPPLPRAATCRPAPLDRPPGTPGVCWSACPLRALCVRQACVTHHGWKQARPCLCVAPGFSFVCLFVFLAAVSLALARCAWARYQAADVGRRALGGERMEATRLQASPGWRRGGQSSAPRALPGYSQPSQIGGQCGSI